MLSSVKRRWSAATSLNFVLLYSLRPLSQPFFVAKKNTPVNDEQSKVVIGNLSSYSVTWIECYRYTSGTPFKYFESYPVTTGQAVSLAPK
jgi:hypothetical protein